MELIKPTIDLAEQIMEFKKEFDGGSIHGGSNLATCSSVEEWIEHITQLSSKDTCPTDLVPSTTLLVMNDDKIIGIADIRHHINHPLLSKWGGHIGYSLRPTERYQGYGPEMLRQVLKKAKNLELPDVLLCCDADNTASEKVILANGGQYERSVDIDGSGTFVKRYWITT